MGLKYPYSKSIDANTELRKADARAKQMDIVRLDKTYPNTWRNGSTGKYNQSNLDHVYASDNLKFKSFSAIDGSKAAIDVRR